MKGIETNPLETHLTLGTRIAELEVGRQEGEPTFSLVRQEGKPKQFNQPEPTFRGFLSFRSLQSFPPFSCKKTKEGQLSKLQH
jgi:hypothetical protein